MKSGGESSGSEKAAAESPKIVSFPEIDEKIRMQVCNTPLYTLTQTEQADDRENAALVFLTGEYE